MTELTHERLVDLLRYEPDTGLFWWRMQRRGRGSMHRPAGGTRERGYRIITIDGRLYRAHRLAVFYVTGKWPEHEVDHRHGLTSDNRFGELRDVPRPLNAQNMRKPTGIEHRPGRPRPYRVSITVGGRKINVGSFATEVEAKAARHAAKLKWHPGYVPDISPILPQTSVDGE